MSVVSVDPKTFVPTKYHYSATSYAKYLTDSEAHNADDFVKERNERVSSNCGDMAVVIRQQKKHMDYRKNAVQAYSVVQSFSKDELDYKDNDDIRTAHQIGCEFAERLNEKFGGRHNWAVYTQSDGEGHMIHNHLVLLNYGRDGHPVPHGVNWGKDLFPLNDEITGKYLTSEKQRAVREKTYETAKKISESSAKENGERRRGIQKERKEFVETAFYKALKNSSTEKQLSQTLKQQGITVQKRYRGTLPADYDDETGIDFTWRTKTGKPRKSLGLTYKGQTFRTNKFERSMLTSEIIEQVKQNRQRLQQRRVRIEKQVDQQPTIPKPTAIVTKKQQPQVAAKPKKTTSAKASRQQSQPVAKYSKKQANTNKQPEKSIKPVQHFDRQQTINLLQQQLQFIRQRLLNEKKKEKVSVFVNTEQHLAETIAQITSQQMVANVEKAKKKEEEVVPE